LYPGDLPIRLGSAAGIYIIEIYKTATLLEGHAR
jgi:hypothetical protein